MMLFSPAIRVCLLACAAMTLSACAPLGPRTISVSRPLYNEAVQQTEAQQLLLNIVRQRYNDPVLFLDVTSISSGTNRSVNASLLTKILPSGRDELSEGVGASFSESPVIFYTPNTGEKFVRQMLAPLDLRTITLLLQSGWSIERVMLVTGDSINGLRNVIGGGSLGRDFGILAKSLRDLQRNGQLTLGVDGAGKDVPASVTLVFAPEAKTSPAYTDICRVLNTACDGRTISLRQGIGFGNAGGSTGKGDAASLATRSLYSAMYFLAQGVEIPPPDAQRGAAVQNKDAQGKPFDWAEVHGDLFQVRSSATEPQKAHVKVFYRNVWFYIPDTDADSKVTFALMSMLVMLQAGDANKITPLITLPAM
jgi:hypothetical protein